MRLAREPLRGTTASKVQTENMPPSCFAAPALAWYRDPSWWTAGATVVLAIASIIAGALAAKAFAKQRDLLAIEQNRDIEREEGVKRADASRVSAWPLYKGPDDFDWVAVLRNPTNLPIYLSLIHI